MCINFPTTALLIRRKESHFNVYGRVAREISIMEALPLGIACANPSLPPTSMILSLPSQTYNNSPSMPTKPDTTMSTASSSPTSTSSASSAHSWSISDDSLMRYVSYASESCVQELLSASESGRVDSDSDGWKVLALLEDGVEVSKRRLVSPHVFRSRSLLRSVSPQQFSTVANTIDAAKQWAPDLVEAKYIKDLDDNLSIVRLRFGHASKSLFKNREFIVYERRETMDDGTLVVAVASLPKEIAEGLHPKQNNSIRGLLLQSGWVVEKLEGNSCMVTYVIQLDPAGWLPKYFVNRLSMKLVMIIDNLKKLAQACPVSGET